MSDSDPLFARDRLNYNLLDPVSNFADACASAPAPVSHDRSPPPPPPPPPPPLRPAAVAAAAALHRPPLTLHRAPLALHRPPIITAPSTAASAAAADGLPATSTSGPDVASPPLACVQHGGLPLPPPLSGGPGALSVAADPAGPARALGLSGESAGASPSGVIPPVPPPIPMPMSAGAGRARGDDRVMSDVVRQAYIFLSECNRQELRKIARRWNCPQGFTKGVLVAKLVIFIHDQVDRNKTCSARDILGVAPEWGFEGFLAQWETTHSTKAVASLLTLEKLAKCNSKNEADSALPDLPKMSGKRKWRKTRMREREQALTGHVVKLEPSIPLKKPKTVRSAARPSSAPSAATAKARVAAAAAALAAAAAAGSGMVDVRDEAAAAGLTTDSNNLPVLPLPVADADGLSLNKVSHKLVEVSDRMMQYMKMSNGKSGMGGATEHVQNEGTEVRTELPIETERKLLLELKVAKKEIEDAKEDNELLQRWTVLADRIRKKLDVLTCEKFVQ